MKASILSMLALNHVLVLVYRMILRYSQHRIRTHVVQDCIWIQRASEEAEAVYCDETVGDGN